MLKKREGCEYYYRNSRSDSLYVGNLATPSENQIIGEDTFPTNSRVQSYSVATIPTNCQVHPFCLDIFPFSSK